MWSVPPPKSQPPLRLHKILWRTLAMTKWSSLEGSLSHTKINKKRGMCKWSDLHSLYCNTSILNVPYSRKYWRGLKFGGLAADKATVKLKFANISYTRLYVWRYHTEPPIFLLRQLKTKPPNLKTTNMAIRYVWDTRRTGVAIADEICWVGLYRLAEILCDHVTLHIRQVGAAALRIPPKHYWISSPILALCKQLQASIWPATGAYAVII